jgi:hypothetical protein
MALQHHLLLDVSETESNVNLRLREVSICAGTFIEDRIIRREIAKIMLALQKLCDWFSIAIVVAIKKKRVIVANFQSPYGLRINQLPPKV